MVYNTRFSQYGSLQSHSYSRTEQQNARSQTKVSYASTENVYFVLNLILLLHCTPPCI
jgi:hypothetical protein